MKKILLGTIGYHLLRNHSIGPYLLPKIRQLPWAGKVVIDEMNWGPIAIVQNFQDQEEPYGRVVFFTAIERADRAIGSCTVFKWGGNTPTEREVQACMGDAVTGVISAENLLIIGEYFKIWPQEVYLVDVEPGPEESGSGLSADVSAQVPRYFDILEKVCLSGTILLDNFKIIYGDQIMMQ